MNKQKKLNLGENEYIDLSGISEEEKRAFLLEFNEKIGKEILKVFLSLGLESHINSTFICNENTYLFSFTKLENHVK